MGAIYYTLGDDRGVPLRGALPYTTWGDARDAGRVILASPRTSVRRLQILKVTTACHGYVERESEHG